MYTSASTIIWSVLPRSSTPELSDRLAGPRIDVDHNAVDRRADDTEVRLRARPLERGRRRGEAAFCEGNVGGPGRLQGDEPLVRLFDRGLRASEAERCILEIILRHGTGAAQAFRAIQVGRRLFLLVFASFQAGLLRGDFGQFFFTSRLRQLHLGHLQFGFGLPDSGIGRGEAVEDDNRLPTLHRIVTANQQILDDGLGGAASTSTFSPGTIRPRQWTARGEASAPPGASFFDRILPGRPGRAAPKAEVAEQRQVRRQGCGAETRGTTFLPSGSRA